MNIQPWKYVCSSLKLSNTCLLAVSKYTSDENVASLLKAGQVDFAESKAQNLRDRASKFTQARWHFIGPLQKNKAKYIGAYATMWHSLVDIETAKAVAKHVQNRVLPVLIQVNISSEAQKQGVAKEDARQLCMQVSKIPELQVVGLMGMAAKDGDCRASFQALRALRDDLQGECGTVRELCMGMSGDWRVAVDEGASMIRLGRAIFEAMENKD